MSIRLRVPATSANLGPGFDVLGVALSMYNYFEFDTIDSGLEITGCNPDFANEDNYAILAWRAVEKKIGAAPCGIRLNISAEVPVARGLGSSATLLAAGAEAANHHYGDPLDDIALLEIITAIEGHPDNVAPALLGGLRASMMTDGKVFGLEYPVHPALGFCALVPNFETTTHEARGVLPKEVPFADAVFNLSRLAVMLRALETGDLADLGATMADKLHQPYRKSLIHEYDLVRQTALDLGASAFCISGSGSTLMAILPVAETEVFARKIEEKLAASPYAWRAYPLCVDTDGAKVL